MLRRRSDATDLIGRLTPVIDRMSAWSFESLLDMLVPIYGRQIYLSRAELPKGCTAGAMAAPAFDLIMIDVAAAGQYKDWICSHELGHVLLGHLTKPNQMFLGSFAHLAGGMGAGVAAAETCPFTGAMENAAELFAEQLVSHVYGRPHLHTPGRAGRLATVLE
jgi:hypothetical protein